jgi:ketosteroid isomerase-like protein
MSDESATPNVVELVRRVNEAWSRRDVDGWSGVISPDIVYRPVPTFTDSQERRGLAAIRRFMEEWHDAWAADYTTQTESIREYGDAVIALIRFSGHARASGIEIRGGLFQVFRFRDGLIVRLEEFTDRAEALRAAGVAE